MSKKKENKSEGMMAIIAALLVVFTAMIDPIYSVVLAGTLLLSFAVYKFLEKK